MHFHPLLQLLLSVPVHGYSGATTPTGDFVDSPLQLAARRGRPDEADERPAILEKEAIREQWQNQEPDSGEPNGDNSPEENSSIKMEHWAATLAWLIKDVERKQRRNGLLKRELCVLLLFKFSMGVSFPATTGKWEMKKILEEATRQQQHHQELSLLLDSDKQKGDNSLEEHRAATLAWLIKDVERKQRRNGLLKRELCILLLFKYNMGVSFPATTGKWEMQKMLEEATRQQSNNVVDFNSPPCE
jgi:hypothetical protein